MARIKGIGGVFCKAQDPQALAKWYEPTNKPEGARIELWEPPKP